MKSLRKSQIGLLVVIASVFLMLPTTTHAAATKALSVNTYKQMELRLYRNGYPVGRVDGILDQDTRRALCIWRDYSRQSVSRNLPSKQEVTLIVSSHKPVAPRRLVTGLNISRTCQTVTLVSVSKAQPERFVEAIYKASTGQPGFETRKGTFKIYAQLDKWVESDLYPGAMMYRPKFFSGGQALHGSWTNALVLPYPASHGCVRMSHGAIDYLWSHGVGIGTKVFVYGNWRG